MNGARDPLSLSFSCGGGWQRKARGTLGGVRANVTLLNARQQQQTEGAAAAAALRIYSRGASGVTLGRGGYATACARKSMCDRQDECMYDVLIL